ncbi:MAG: carbohydrate kinase family protein, partial [Gemmatimonadetes bacterium]|nr:carbohydrate kinase family protein [Gemmatimonadota bacterium]
YSLAAMAAALPRGWEIVPLLKVGSDLAEEARDFLAGVPGLLLREGLRVVPEPNNRVELRYLDADRREEQLRGGVSPWSARELEPLLRDVDALYVNFISGYEMELADAERLRAVFRGPIYADLHSLLLGRMQDGRRTLRPLPEWRRWLRCFDAIQLNEDELATLAGRGGEEWAFAIEAVRDGGPMLIMVTLAGEGAECIYRTGVPANPLDWPLERNGAGRGRSAVRSSRVAPPQGRVEGDPTGCGDVWGSTLFAALLGGLEIETAMRRAHTAAGHKVTYRGAAGLYSHLRSSISAG